MRRARILSQIFFLLVFAALFFGAQYHVAAVFPTDLFFRTSPLIIILVSIAGRIIVASLLIVTLITLLTLLFGRVFCGWVCPLGTAIDFSAKLLKNPKPSATASKNIKFYLLFLLIVTSFFSYQLVWLFDPVVLLYRTTTLLLHPLFKWTAEISFGQLFQIEALYETAYSVYDKSRFFFIGSERVMLVPSLFTATLFFTILFLEKKSSRFWCRYICPLGGLFGLLSRGRILKRQVSDDCKDCITCINECKMGALESGRENSNPMDCILCGNCVASCPRKSVKYVPTLGYKSAPFDPSRRGFMLAGIGSVSMIGLSKVGAVRNDDRTIRPPGALLEDEFLDHCIRCQACVRACASTGACLQPVWLDSGLEAILSPAVMPSFGYCEFNCNLCGQVCPTGAIQPLDLDVKKTTKIGLPYFDKNRCLPYAEATDCLVCQEHCPTPDKAIKIEEKVVELPNGKEKMVKIPYIIKELCIGCGICENKCPVKGSPGIVVTKEGEERLTLKS